MHTRTLDISEGGVCLEWREATDDGDALSLFIGKVLELCLDLPLDEGPWPLQVQCAVRYLRESGHENWVGMRFVHLADEQQAAVNAFIAQHAEDEET